VRLIKTARKRNPGLQLLLFSATFNEKIKNFAIRIAPRANQVRACWFFGCVCAPWVVCTFFESC